MSLDDWLREVQRLSEPLLIRTSGSPPDRIGVEYVPVQPPGGKARVAWIASCGAARVERATAEEAMRDLLGELRDRLDKQIAQKKSELNRLQDARRRGLKIAGGE